MRASQYLLVHHRNLRVEDYPWDGVYSLVDLPSPAEAKRYLQRFSGNPAAMKKLEALVDEQGDEEDEDEEEALSPAAGLRNLRTGAQARKRDVLALVAELIAEGELGIAEQVERFNPPTKLEEKTEAAPAQQPESPKTEKKLTFIEIKVVNDETALPMNWVRMIIRTPDGNADYYTTNSDGMIRIDELEKGTCDASCDLKDARLKDTLAWVGTGEAKGKDNPPLTQLAPGTLRIAEVEEHKVKKGESLDGLAKGVGMTWKELAKFNWGTDVPAKINQHLRDDVGCTKKTSDGANYVFDDSDDPGIVYIPKKWKQDGLATGTTHIFRVKVLAPPAALYVRLDIDPQEAKENGDKFTLKSTDEEYSSEKTVKDDLEAGDKYIDLRFAKLNPALSYTLEVKSGEGEAAVVFENVPYAELTGLSQGRPTPAGFAEAPPEDDAFPELGPEEKDKTGEE